MIISRSKGSVQLNFRRNLWRCGRCFTPLEGLFSGNSKTESYKAGRKTQGKKNIGIKKILISTVCPNSLEKNSLNTYMYFFAKCRITYILFFISNFWDILDIKCIFRTTCQYLKFYISLTPILIPSTR